MDYHNLKKSELISLVKKLKRDIEILNEKQKIYNILYTDNSITYIKFNKEGIIKYSDNNYIYDEKLNALRYQTLKEIKTIENKSLQDYFNIWKIESKPQTIKIKFETSRVNTFRCFFTRENNSNYICILSDISEISDLQRKYEISETKFRQIFDDLKIGISVLDKEFRIVFANKKMKDYFPHIIENSDMICYKTYNDPPRDAPCIYCPCIKTLEDGEIHETITETPSGDKLRYFLLRSTPIKDNNNEVLYILELVEDISEKIKIEQSIDFQNTFIRYLIDSIPAGIFYKDLNLRYVGCNKVFAEYFKMKPSEITYKTAYDLYSKTDAEKLEYFDKEIIKNLKLQTNEYQIKNPITGNLEYFLIHKSPYFDNEGKVKGIIGIKVNVTEIKQMEHQLAESFEFINELIEQTNSMVINIDLDGNIKIFNKAAEEVTGYKREEVLGKNWFLIFNPPKKYPELYNTFSEFRKRKTLTKDYFTNFILTKSGDEKLIRWRNNLLKKSGKVVGITAIGVDITDENTLTIDNLYSIIEVIPHPILIIDNNLNIEYANSAFTKLTGYNSHEVVGKRFGFYEFPENDKMIYENILNSLRKSGNWNGEFLSRTKNGEYYYESNLITSINNSKNKEKNYVVVKFNIDKEKKIIAELNNLKKINENISIYRSIIDLILKEVINITENTNDKNTNLHFEKLKNLEIIQDKFLMNLLLLANNILNNDVSKVKREIEELELMEMLKSVYRSINTYQEKVKFQYPKRKNKVNIRCDNRILELIVKILNHILINIIEEGTVKIEFKKTKKIGVVYENMLLIGRSKNIIDKNLLLFEKKSNRDKDFNTDFHSSKFHSELITLKKLINLIDIDLLLKVRNKREIEVELVFPKTDSTLDKNKIKKKVKRVLLVEDNLSNAEIIKIYLQDKFDIIWTKSITETLEKAREEVYDILIIDIDLGNEKDGLEILKELRKISKYKSKPFIAITGYTNFLDRQNLLEAGFTEHIAKPFRKEQLLSIIKKYI
ncbi:MAG: PAS domain S-box protein [Ignavibacteria bacterium]|nr:PAS domain S-box protein [Ignavibacteria bacterium]